jgi:histidinol-phosphate/aromatic aminotransferase/cobyric acid decarboxylase-like protein
VRRPKRGNTHARKFAYNGCTAPARAAEEDSVEDFADLAQQAGVSKTVYSIYWPFTRDLIDGIWRTERDDMHRQYEEAWTKKQDTLHEPYLERWAAWATPLRPPIARHVFPHQYPANGSSEALRETLADFAANRRGNTLHVFTGEYEGYEAYARGYGVRVLHHDRRDFAAVEQSFGVGDIFMLSQPSAIDGNLWPDYDAFLRHMAERHPQVEVMLDLCYVGLVARDYGIEIGYPNITRLFFSLSKVFGVYYHRMGGVFSKREIAGLYGNMWFKNLHSIHLARRLLEASQVRTIPDLFRSYQRTAVKKLQNRFPHLQESDAILLGHHRFEADAASDVDRFLRRDDVVRYCLTPAMETSIRSGQR